MNMIVTKFSIPCISLVFKYLLQTTKKINHFKLRKIKESNNTRGNSKNLLITLKIESSGKWTGSGKLKKIKKKKILRFT